MNEIIKHRLEEFFLNREFSDYGERIISETEKIKDFDGKTYFNFIKKIEHAKGINEIIYFVKYPDKFFSRPVYEWCNQKLKHLI